MDLEQSTTKKLLSKLMPLIMLLYFVAFIDRANIGIASLTMNKDLGISAAAYGLGAGLFFIGYFIFEVPSNIILAKVGARIWITRILITWGIVSSCMMFVQNETQLYVARFVLGAAEAGFYPGIIYYLGDWFPTNAKTRAFGYFHMSLPISMCVGNVISGFILKMNGIAGLAGWQWVFLIEGIPAVLLGFVVYKYLLDAPKDAKWLDDKEKDWLINQIKAEKAARPLGRVSTLELLKKPHVWLFSSIYLTLNIGFYGITFWLPQIVKQLSHADNTMASIYSALPWAFAGIVMFYVARFADKSGERKKFVVIPLFIGSVGLVLSIVFKEPVLALAALAVTTACCECPVGPFWTFPTRMFNGVAAAAAIAIVNSIGNLGGFVGPYIFGIVTGKGANFKMGILFLAAMMLLSSILAMFLREVKVEAPATDKNIQA